MGKHNGKARKSGMRVGAALVNSAKRDGKGQGVGVHNLHTTDLKPNPQSMLEASDLTELMDMANLADQDFAAEKQHVVILNTTLRTALDDQRDVEARNAAEARHAERLRIPRRPAWSPAMTAEQVDAQERAAFLAWRRALAAVEEEEELVLTPFEKNLEMWRQLWRVLERSHVVVQVVDARDPLLYRSADLEAYARELHPAKRSLLLLNKADLLTPAQHEAWSTHLLSLGLEHAFWSAKAAGEGLLQSGEEGQGGSVQAVQPLEMRGEVGGEAGGAAGSAPPLMGVEGLLDWLEDAARNAAAAAGDTDLSSVVVGLTGYPNVGKSSTINALYGKKKTAVAPTPGKTKHFQTLHVRPGLTLCDCPGLVLPRFAANKAEMVAAGVLPIDRLTDTRPPVHVVAQRVGRRQLEAVYGLRLPMPAMHEQPGRPPTAVELLRSLAMARGWVVANGLPDEARAARHILRDYTAGRLVWVATPPGTDAQGAAGAQGPVGHEGQQGVVEGQQGVVEGEGRDGDGLVAHVASSSREGCSGLDLTEADLDLLQDLEAETQGAAKPRRKEYKFQRKAPRTKGTRGQEKFEGMEDGLGLKTGKKGGLVRVGGYV